MVIRTRQGNVEIRSQEWGTSHIIPQPGTAFITDSGALVTEDIALGMPAVSNVVRAPAETLGSLPFLTYRDNPRRRAENDWRWELLHDLPDDLGTGTYTFFYDVELSLEVTQNAFIQKAKSKRRIEALYVIDPQRVRVYRDKQGVKRFDVYVGDGETKKGMTSADIHHIRGFSRIPGGVVGTSLIELHRNALGSGQAMQSFEGDYFRNSAVPPFFFTGARNQEHAKELMDLHNASHAGPGNQFKVGALWGAIDVKSIPISMADAQYVEAKQMSVEEACRIWRWPKELLELSNTEAQRTSDENAWTAKMLKFYVLPRLKRIERSFAADPDLYAGSGLIGEFLTAALERADFVSRMRGYKDARQGGWVTANEVRDYENLPPHDGGDTLLETPTGSAPNQVPTSEGGGGPTSNGKVPAGATSASAAEQEWS